MTDITRSDGRVAKGVATRVHAALGRRACHLTLTEVRERVARAMGHASWHALSRAPAHAAREDGRFHAGLAERLAASLAEAGVPAGDARAAALAAVGDDAARDRSRGPTRRHGPDGYLERGDAPSARGQLLAALGGETGVWAAGALERFPVEVAGMALEARFRIGEVEATDGMDVRVRAVNCALFDGGRDVAYLDGYLLTAARGGPAPSDGDAASAMDEMDELAAQIGREVVADRPGGAPVTSRGSALVVAEWQGARGVARGLGAGVLRATAEGLRRRRRAVATLVVPVRPLQHATAWGQAIGPGRGEEADRRNLADALGAAGHQRAFGPRTMLRLLRPNAATPVRGAARRDPGAWEEPRSSPMLEMWAAMAMPPRAHVDAIADVAAVMAVADGETPHGLVDPLSLAGLVGMGATWLADAVARRTDDGATMALSRGLADLWERHDGDIADRSDMAGRLMRALRADRPAPSIARRCPPEGWDGSGLDGADLADARAAMSLVALRVVMERDLEDRPVPFRTARDGDAGLGLVAMAVSAGAGVVAASLGRGALADSLAGFCAAALGGWEAVAPTVRRLRVPGAFGVADGPDSRA